MISIASGVIICVLPVLYVPDGLKPPSNLSVFETYT
jgi:hypothetical protein